MISCSTFYSFTLSCTVAAGLISKPDTREWTNRHFLLPHQGPKIVKSNLDCTKCIHSSLNEWEESLYQMLRLSICQYLSETMCYNEVNDDRYILTTDRNSASIDNSQLNHRYPIDYQFNFAKNIVHYELIKLSKCSSSRTSGVLGPFLSWNSSV